MASRGALRPKSVEERFQALAGDGDSQSLLYLAKAKLGYEPHEWEALPWWQQAVYEAGLRAEFMKDDEDGEVDPAALGITMRTA